MKDPLTKEACLRSNMVDIVAAHCYKLARLRASGTGAQVPDKLAAICCHILRLCVEVEENLVMKLREGADLLLALASCKLSVQHTTSLLQLPWRMISTLAMNWLDFCCGFCSHWKLFEALVFEKQKITKTMS